MRNTFRNKNKQIKDLIKLSRKESREAEIKAHSKPVKQFSITDSSKKYKRSKRINLDENDS